MLGFSYCIDVYRLSGEEEREIREVAADEQYAFSLAELSAGEGCQPEEDTAAYEGYPVDEGYLRHRHRHDAAARAYDEGDIEDVAAHHVAEGEAKAAFTGGHDARGEFGQAGAAGQDGHADDAFTDAPLAGYGSGIVHQHLSANHQSRHANQDEQEATPQAGLYLLLPLGGGREGGLPVLHRNPVGQVHIATEAADEQQAFPAGYHVAGDGKSDEQDGESQTDGQVAPQQCLLHRHRPHDGRHAENDQDIEHIAADDIAHAHIRTASEHAHEAHHELGQARAQRHDRQADDEFADLQASGQAAGTVRETVRPPKHDGNAYHYQNYLKYHIILYINVRRRRARAYISPANIRKISEIRKNFGP